MKRTDQKAPDMDKQIASQTDSGDLDMREVMDYLLYHSNYRVGMVYDFVMVCSAMINIPKEYEPGIMLTIVEASIVMEVVRSPGITAAQLSRKWKRTRSALSQSIKKLKQKGMIETQPSPENQKKILLYPTEAGTRLWERIVKNKEKDKNSIIEHLLKNGCTLEELNTFYRVMDIYTQTALQQPSGGWQDLIPE